MTDAIQRPAGRLPRRKRPTALQRMALQAARDNRNTYDAEMRWHRRQVYPVAVSPRSLRDRLHARLLTVPLWRLVRRAYEGSAWPRKAQAARILATRMNDEGEHDSRVTKAIEAYGVRYGVADRPAHVLSYMDIAELSEFSSQFYAHTDDTCTTSDGERLLEDETCSCDDCNEYFRHESVRDGRCESCREEHDGDGDGNGDDDDNDSGYIRYHSFRVEHTLGFHTATSHTGTPSAAICYLGTELEISVNRDSARAVAGICDGYALLKEDSSIPDGGYEIVTAPATLTVHQKFWAEHGKALETCLHGYNAAAWDAPRRSCGMHVHFSRSFLKADAIYELVRFINSPRNHDFIVKLAGRNSTSWARKYEKPSVAAIQSEAGNRYQAVNLTNTNTIEIRIFRGTYAPGRIVKNLEFVQSLVDAVKSDASWGSWTLKRFTEFVADKQDHYPAFAAYLASLDVVPAMVA